MTDPRGGGAAFGVEEGAGNNHVNAPNHHVAAAVKQDVKLAAEGANAAAAADEERVELQDEEQQIKEARETFGTIDRYGFTIRRSQKRGSNAGGDIGGSSSLAGGDDDDDEDGVDAGGGGASVIDIDVLRKREVKWREMLDNWNHYMTRDYKKVRSRCRKGIPASIRSKAWLNLCGAKFLMEKPENKDRYKQLCNHTGYNKWTEDIEKDLHRNFPTHEMFGGTYERIGRKELYDVLRAYSLYNPKDGYCQAQAPVAALLLMNMPEEEAFWTLVSICDRYIQGYYSPGMKTIQMDADILLGLFRKVSPPAHKHLVSQGIEPLMFMTEWFLCVFSRSLPWPSVLRIWDMFMCEGVKVVFKVGLVLLKHTLTKSTLKQCPTLYETLTVLKNLPASVTAEEALMSKVLTLNVEEQDMKREHLKQLAIRAKKEKQQQSSQQQQQRQNGGVGGGSQDQNKSNNHSSSSMQTPTRRTTTV